MKKGFTLIELLIVVAIIAILAAIAVPNFLEAQVRAKVSRGKSDMRSLVTAIEAYAVDNNKYFPPIDPRKNYATDNNPFGGQSVFSPSGSNGANSVRFIWVTTPIAYITSAFQEAFTVNAVAAGSAIAGDDPKFYDSYDYWTDEVYYHGTLIATQAGLSCGAKYRLCGVGPDRKACNGGKTVAAGPTDESNIGGCLYDATNGTVSAGDLVRIGPPSDAGRPTNLPFFDRGHGSPL